MTTPEELAKLESSMSAEERHEFHRLLEGWEKPVWEPLSGPQRTAYESQADVVGFGGAAGGGKTDLVIGKALTRHRRTLILRPVGTELAAIRDRVGDILGSKDGYNGRDNVWRWKGRHIEFGAVPDVGDAQKYQGRPHDLLVADEAANFREADIRFLSTWVRTTVKGQKCQTILTFNPPTTAEGRWVIAFFAPWLDRKHPNPARSGELRWFVVVQDEMGNSRDVEVPDNRLRVQEGDRLETDFDEKTVDKLKILRPQSRTFIPSKVSDNKYLLETGYVSQLQSLPEPLRSQMLHGDFLAGVRDDEWQVIPTLWVEMAQARWTEDGREDYLSAMGVDVARGGRDKTVIAKRYGAWVDRLIKKPGKDTPDGMYVVRLIQEALAMETEMNHAMTHIDATGVGTSPADMARWEGLAVNPVVFGAGTYARDRSGIMRMRNVRAWLWWNLRDMLDPDKGDDLALPPDPEIVADLTSARWKPTVSGVQVEDKIEIIKRIGRSPDCGEAIVLCFYPHASQNIVTKRALNMNRRGGLGRGGERAISNAYRIGR